jgi:hypothetical protein
MRTHQLNDHYGVSCDCLQFSIVPWRGQRPGVPVTRNPSPEDIATTVGRPGHQIGLQAPPG